MSPDASVPIRSSRNILIVGHSHIHAMRMAAVKRREDDPDRPRTRTIYLLDPAFAPEMEGCDFSPGLKRAILDQVGRHDPIIASAIGGNTHAAAFMIAKERFDFEIDGGDVLPLEQGVPIRSEAEVGAILADWIAPDLHRMTLLHALVGPFAHLESPPPVRRTDWVIAHAEPYFTGQAEFHSHGIAPAGLRYRAWLLANRMIRDQCGRLGCRYIEVPRIARGEAGLLRPSFARDATHGNIAFGETMLQALEAAG